MMKLIKRALAFLRPAPVYQVTINASGMIKPDALIAELMRRTDEDRQLRR